MHWKLHAVLDAAVLLLLLVLDARDLWYKTQWLGPSDAFAYSTKSSVRLVDTWTENTAADSLTGWRAFHATCGELRVLTGSGKIADGRPHYLYVLAANCSGPDGLTEEMEPQLESMILKSDMRADAMAWAACKLLYISRRPPLCQDAMVTGFIHRYRLGAPRVTSAMMATPMSGAERELRALLDVIAKSLLLSTVVCVGGVELPSTEQQEELPLRRIFGCGSPNLPGKSAAFVGQYATAFADLQMDKARLTMDDIDILGMRFIFRQNAVRNYVYHPPTSAGSVEEHQSSFRGHMEVRTSLNLSCSGFLYNIMVFVDVVLLMMHAWSAFELLERLILSSLLRTPTKHDMRDLSKGEGRWSLFACSLVHSPPVAILMMISALLSWLLLLPHTAVWALSSDESSYSAAAVHTLLSALRVWVLLLLLVKALWSIFVFFDEGRAYMLATRTYVSSAEIVMAVATAGVLLRRRLLSVLPSKHEMDHQQVVDGAAFPGRLAISNAFEDVARSLSIRTQHPVLWLIYSPLIELLLLSSVIVGLGMTARYLLQSHRLHVAENAVTTVEDVDGILDDTFPTTSRPSTAGFSTAQAVIAGYKRLPLEELLDVPIRAKHIVRSSGDGGLEKTVDNDQFLWTVQYLSHGVLLENDRFLSTRRGFFRVLPMIEPVDASGRPSASGVCGKETSGSPKRRRYTTTFSFT